MLSRRDKLLIQPWENRRYKDHREKVKCALPAIDDRAPKKMPHVTTKLKKNQKEKERKGNIEKENFSLLQRLSAVMKLKRIDNQWKKPLPNFHNKVGLYYTVGTSYHSNFNEVTPSSDESRQRLCEAKPNRCSACHQVSLGYTKNSEGSNRSFAKVKHQFGMLNKKNLLM